MNYAVIEISGENILDIAFELIKLDTFIYSKYVAITTFLEQAMEGKLDSGIKDKLKVLYTDFIDKHKSRMGLIK